MAAHADAAAFGDGAGPSVGGKKRDVSLSVGHAVQRGSTSLAEKDVIIAPHDGASCSKRGEGDSEKGRSVSGSGGEVKGDAWLAAQQQAEEYEEEEDDFDDDMYVVSVHSELRRLGLKP